MRGPKVKVRLKKRWYAACLSLNDRGRPVTHILTSADVQHIRDANTAYTTTRRPGVYYAVYSADYGHRQMHEDDIQMSAKATELIRGDVRKAVPKKKKVYKKKLAIRKVTVTAKPPESKPKQKKVKRSTGIRKVALKAK